MRRSRQIVGQGEERVARRLLQEDQASVAERQEDAPRIEILRRSKGLSPLVFFSHRFVPRMFLEIKHSSATHSLCLSSLFHRTPSSRRFLHVYRQHLVGGKKTKNIQISFFRHLGFLLHAQQCPLVLFTTRVRSTTTPRWSS